MNCLKNANFFGILQECMHAIVCVSYITYVYTAIHYTVSFPFAISNEQCEWRMENSINVLLAMDIQMDSKTRRRASKWLLFTKVSQMNNGSLDPQCSLLNA